MDTSDPIAIKGILCSIGDTTLRDIVVTRRQDSIGADLGQRLPCFCGAATDRTDLCGGGSEINGCIFACVRRIGTGVRRKYHNALCSLHGACGIYTVVQASLEGSAGSEDTVGNRTYLGLGGGDGTAGSIAVICIL